MGFFTDSKLFVSSDKVNNVCNGPGTGRILKRDQNCIIFMEGWFLSCKSVNRTVWQHTEKAIHVIYKSHITFQMWNNLRLNCFNSGWVCQQTGDGNGFAWGTAWFPRSTINGLPSCKQIQCILKNGVCPINKWIN